MKTIFGKKKTEFITALSFILLAIHLRKMLDHKTRVFFNLTFKNFHTS